MFGMVNQCCAGEWRVSLRQAAPYFDALGSMPMSLHTVEAVSRLAAGAKLPRSFLGPFISRCIAACQSSQVCVSNKHVCHNSPETLDLNALLSRSTPASLLQAGLISLSSDSDCKPQPRPDRTSKLSNALLGATFCPNSGVTVSSCTVARPKHASATSAHAPVSAWL